MYLSIGYANYGFWVLGAVVGIIFIVHGFPKIKNPKGIAAVYKAPSVVGLFHGLAEVVGGALLIIGFCVQGAAMVLGLIMIGAIYFKVVRWNTNFVSRDNTGWELDLVLWAACVALLLV
ncbi:MAG: hypothetical protein A2925_00615 [Candidatus Yanofskybacteria bacterium RIFCSPLOWO2_01_FULL_44_22]|uniref:DoxX family protein n=2 Tax=Candidatus Yanofskyibacteriota TaxID=1752733 RepID=A0A1F8GIY4_9BACT|nr:MAG: DoxX [Candidatus Yanofskybacteria bacterium GW2011_GWA2_44_9]OGN04247.1 MAG: hypothetical protein A2659_03105 [Candidatus Yanofskybacteria bacterium RIFCSPHIGHO2_01_FULL_44_24]OGN25354.1 MAG: hypothetical protein A2925_00615 [Candidatus Yanofskybacteria bacterium RIFCSPLOWO2_01_FULL_44_22]